MLIWLLGSFIIAYLLGSIPFGLLLTRMMGHGDLRRIGSGNIGATNAMRTGNKTLGILTLLMDAAKGMLAVVFCMRFYTPEYAILGGLFAVLGHIFPVWLRFKGGKGVATSFGVLFALNPVLGGIVCLLWLLLFAMTRISSISSLMSIGYSAIIAYMVDQYLSALLCLCLAALILFTHRSNITRLLEGKEHRFPARA